MDLGIRGKRAIVCASSKGLGKACAVALAREGVQVTINSRNGDNLKAAADGIRAATGSEVRMVVGDTDLTTGDGLMVVCMLAAIAANESSTKSRRVRRKMEQNAAA